MSSSLTYFDGVLLGVLPYVAIFTFLLVTIQRYRGQAFTYSSLSSQFLENRQHFYGLVPFHYGILVVLADGECHGWGPAQALDEPGAARLLPGHLYRTLDRMLEDGLIAERDRSADHESPAGKRGATPSRFFRLTPLGRDVARAETDRLAALVERSRAGRLLGARK